MSDSEKRLRKLWRYRRLIFAGRALLLLVAAAGLVWLITLFSHESAGTMSFACCVAIALGGAAIWAGVRLGRTADDVVEEIHELSRRTYSR